MYITWYSIYYYLLSVGLSTSVACFQPAMSPYSTVQTAPVWTCVWCLDQ